MALTFPASPADGDTHVVGSITWTYSSASGAWTGAMGSSGTVTHPIDYQVSAVQPSFKLDGTTALSEGDVWFDTVNDVMMTYNGATWDATGGSSVWETDGTDAWRTANNVYVGTDTLFVNSTTGFVGIGTSTPVSTIDVDGTAVHTTVASTGALDLAAGQVFNLDSSGNPTVSFSNVPAGKSTTVVVKVSGGGTVNWGGVQWPGGTAPSFSTGTDVVTLFTNDGGAIWVGNSFALDAQ